MVSLLFSVSMSPLLRHPVTISTAIGVVIGVALVGVAFAYDTPPLAAVRIAVGVLLVLVLPGLALSYAAFPAHERIGGEVSERSRGLDGIERATFAFLLSIVVTSATVAVLAKMLPNPATMLSARMLFGTLATVTATMTAVAAARMAPMWWLTAAACGASVLAVFAHHWRGAPTSPRVLLLDAVGVAAVIAIAYAADRARIIPRLFRHPTVGPFFRYCTVGVSNTVIDFGLYTILTRWGTLHYLLANAISFLVAVSWSYIWNRRWTFRSADRRRVRQFVTFVAITLVGVGISEAALAIGVEALRIPDLAAKVLAAPLVLAWNYGAARRWAFRSRDH